MPGIGDTLRAERRRQGRTLADAAAETRVRESYLAAIEEDDFDVLGGDVYARGFIRLYGRYLGLDAEALVEAYRRDHEKPEEVTAIPGATVDEVMAPRQHLVLSQPVLAAAGIVVLLIVLFLVFRGGDEPTAEVDPNAPGPSPAATTPPATDPAGLAPTSAPTAGAAGPAGTTTAPPAPLDGTALTEVVVVVTAVEPVRLTVTRGQPIAQGLLLDPGESREITDPAGQEVVFALSDFSAAEVVVNGGPLAEPSLAGRPVTITCTVGQTGCSAVPG